MVYAGQPHGTWYNFQNILEVVEPKATGSQPREVVI